MLLVRSPVESVAMVCITVTRMRVRVVVAKQISESTNRGIVLVTHRSDHGLGLRELSAFDDEGLVHGDEDFTETSDFAQNLQVAR